MSIQQLQSDAENARPVILESVAAAWPACAKWTPGYFAELLGDLEFNAELGIPKHKEPIQYQLDKFQNKFRCENSPR